MLENIPIFVHNIIVITIFTVCLLDGITLTVTPLQLLHHHINSNLPSFSM